MSAVKIQKPRAPIAAKLGYYVYKNILTGDDISVIYSTGVKGGGGHCYWDKTNGELPDMTLAQKMAKNPNYRPTMGDVDTRPPKFKHGWTTLLWSCVPSKARLPDYTYYATCPAQIPDWK